MPPLPTVTYVAVADPVHACSLQAKGDSILGSILDSLSAMPDILTVCVARHEIIDSQTQSERLQAELKALGQQHADTLTGLEEQHLKALLDSEEEQHHMTREQKKQHEAAVQVMQVWTCPDA